MALPKSAKGKAKAAAGNSPAGRRIKPRRAKRSRGSSRKSGTAASSVAGDADEDKEPSDEDAMMQELFGEPREPDEPMAADVGHSAFSLAVGL